MKFTSRCVMNIKRGIVFKYRYFISFLYRVLKRNSYKIGGGQYPEVKRDLC